MRTSERGGKVECVKEGGRDKKKGSARERALVVRLRHSPSMIKASSHMFSFITRGVLFTIRLNDPG